jgi:O-antigen/teichoic acid export membrane protein
LSTARKFARETTIYGLTTIVQRLLSSLLTPLYTRAYLPKVYSIFSTMFSYASIVQAFLAFGIETTFFRYINKFPDRKKQVYNNGFWIILTISIFFLITSLSLTPTLASLIKIGSDTSQREFAVYTRYFIVSHRLIDVPVG